MNTAMNIGADANNRQTLLIVDDDADWTDVLRHYFVDKYQVRVANFAADALEMARKESPSVIIVDLVMPTIDGFGVLHRLNDGGQTRIPTILLTGWKTSEVEECAAQFGCAAVLAKPVTLSALDEVISSVVSAAMRGERAQSASFGLLH